MILNLELSTIIIILLSIIIPLIIIIILTDSLREKTRKNPSIFENYYKSAIVGVVSGIIVYLLTQVKGDFFKVETWIIMIIMVSWSVLILLIFALLYFPRKKKKK